MLDLRAARSRSFRHLAAAGWVNEFGNWVGEIALAVLVYNYTRSALATAALFMALRFLPALIAPLLAVRLETGSARIVLAIMYLLEAGLFACIAVVSRHFSLPLLLVLAGCDGVLAIAASALSRSALATALSSDGLLREGIALNNFGAMIVIAGAPIVSGLLVASRGVVSALELDSATFIVAALVIVSARGLQIESDPEADFSGRIRAGVRTLRTRPTISRLMVAMSLVIALGSVAVPVEVVFAKTTLHAGDSGYGLLLTSWGVGMVIGSFAFATLRSLRLMSVLAVSTSLIVIGYTGLAAAPSLAVALCFSVIGGTGNSAAWVAARTALQERIPLTRQSALMAVLEACNQVMPAIGFAAGGAITALSSPRIAYAVSAAGVALVLVAFSISRIDRAEPSDTENRCDLDHPAQTQEPDRPARTMYSPTSNVR